MWLIMWFNNGDSLIEVYETDTLSLTITILLIHSPIFPTVEIISAVQDSTRENILTGEYLFF